MDQIKIKKIMVYTLAWLAHAQRFLIAILFYTLVLFTLSQLK